MDFLPRNTNTNENRPLPVLMVVISLHVRVVSANDPANDTNTITIKNTITKFRYLQPLLRLKLKFLTDTFCKQFCTNTNMIMKKPLLELMEKWDVELFVNTNVFVNNFVNKPPRTLQPWQRMLRLADNAMKIMEKDVATN